ncbi:carboxylesterase 5a-like protein [Lasius niger]|uniref:Carboxylesterase 5a-like protein n=1 Tax=Lasius niger TaxID=67767 RepID=A0A0J7KHX2_LASNI|nr:carboxylesterase 5a-like protein [Lasius niger]
MRRATWLLLASVLLLVQRKIHVVRAQRTHARQGFNTRESATVTIPGQGTVLGKEQVKGPIKLHEKLYKRLLSDIPDPGFSEDCLFLNIFAPDGSRQNERWPVMVWFHGGDFNTGTPAIWDASIFVMKQKVLVVTVAYRLNILGFFTTTDPEAPGNYGIFDQIAALDWVKRNIKHFNGSPNNIVIYGHSSGAISVGLHMLSPLSRGKFNKAIAMSGDAIGSVGSPATESQVANVIADKFGCYRQPSSALMECLRRLDADFIVKHSSDIETWGPIFDAETNNNTEPFLPQHPKDILDSGNFNAVPLIVGYTKNEQALALIESGQNLENGLSPEKFETMILDDFSSVVPISDENSTCESKPEMVTNAVLFFYRPYPPTRNATMFRDRYLELQTEKTFAAGLTLLAGKVAKRAATFVYRFDYRAKTQPVTKDVPEWVGVPHMFELPFVWGLPYQMGGTIQWLPNDRKTTDAMMTAMATFAKTGEPSVTGGTGPPVKWEPFTQDNPRILIIDKTIEMGEPNTVDHKALAFWNDYYPQVVEEATTCCNVTSTARRLFSYNVYLSGLTTTMALHLFWF